MSKAAVRAALLGTETPKRAEQVTISINGVDVTVSVRQPTVAQRSVILSTSGAIDVDDAPAKGRKAAPRRADLAQMQVAAVIACTYDPGTDDHIFEDADREVLLNLPTGTWFDTLAELAMKLMNVDAPSQGKPSAAT